MVPVTYEFGAGQPFPAMSGFGPQSSVESIAQRLDGFSPAGRQRGLTREARLVEGARLWADCIEGRNGMDPSFLIQAMAPSSDIIWSGLCRKYPALFQEVMTTSDFTSLTADILDRELLGSS